jgi:hypothetical protein
MGFIVLVRVTTKYFCAGLIANDEGIVIEAAPIMKWAKGKDYADVLAYYSLRNTLVAYDTLYRWEDWVIVIILRDEDFDNPLPPKLEVVGSEDIKLDVRSVVMAGGRFIRVIERVIVVPVDRTEVLVLFDRHKNAAQGQVYRRTATVLHLLMALGSGAVPDEFIVAAGGRRDNTQT